MRLVRALLLEVELGISAWPCAVVVTPSLRRKLLSDAHASSRVPSAEKWSLNRRRFTCACACAMAAPTAADGAPLNSLVRSANAAFAISRIVRRSGRIRASRST
jgi:hypothetical protein